MGAVDTLRKYPFGAKNSETDAVATLRKIRELLTRGADNPAPAPGGRYLSKFEQDTLIEALTQIDAAKKGRKAAEQALADHTAGKALPIAAQPAADSSAAPALSYSMNVVGRDAAGDLKTIDFAPSDTSAPTYRLRVVGRDGAGNLKTLELSPIEAPKARDQGALALH